MGPWGSIELSVPGDARTHWPQIAGRAWNRSSLPQPGAPTSARARPSRVSAPDTGSIRHNVRPATWPTPQPTHNTQPAANRFQITPLIYHETNGRLNVGSTLGETRRSRCGLEFGVLSFQVTLRRLGGVPLLYCTCAVVAESPPTRTRGHLIAPWWTPREAGPRNRQILGVEHARTSEGHQYKPSREKWTVLCGGRLVGRRDCRAHRRSHFVSASRVGAPDLHTREPSAHFTQTSSRLNSLKNVNY